MAGLETACRPPARWRQPETAETIRFENDLVIRDEEDGSVSVLAMVHLEDDWAAGFVRYRGARPLEAKGRYVDTARMRAWQTLAHRLADQPARSFEAAYQGMVVGKPCVIGDVMRVVYGYQGDPTTFPAAERAPDARGALATMIRWCMRQGHPSFL